MPNPRPPKVPFDDVNYFRIAYQIAALQLNAATAGRTVRSEGLSLEPDALRARAASIARQTAKEAQALLDSYEAREQRWWLPHRKLAAREIRLRRFLEETLLPSVELLHAGALEQSDLPSELKRNLESLRERAEAGKLSARSYYNLACWDVSQRRSATADPAREPFTLALADLREAFRRSSGRRQSELVRWAASDPSFSELQRDPVFGERFQELLLSFEGQSTKPRQADSAEGF